MKKKRRSPATASRKMRDLEKTRREILQVAFLEVFARGFQGVSVDDIVRKTSFTKGAFYHQFATKLEMGYALVDEVIQPMILDRWIRPLKECDNPLQGVLGQMQTLMGTADPSQLRLGCPLNNLVQEMSSVDEGFRSRLQGALNLWIHEMEAQLQRAKEGGFLKREVNTLELATFIVMAHEGFYGILKGIGDPKVFSALFENLKVYFETLKV